MHSNETKILQTLSSLEHDFFFALGNGSSVFSSLEKLWPAFNRELETCADELHEDTRLRIHSFVTTVDSIASMLLQVSEKGEYISEQLKDEINGLLRDQFSNLVIDDTPDSLSNTPSAPYIPLAYKWLLQNLHDPYPSKETRIKISTSSNSSLKDVDAWFIDARKRIGWNQLRKDHFAKRSDLIKAATNFFKPAQSVLSPPSAFLKRVDQKVDLSSQFARIEAVARQLYSDKLFPTSLVSNIENTTRQQVKKSSPEIDNRELQQRARIMDHHSSYPSPRYSPTRPSSPVLLPDSPSEPCDRKRSRSYTDLSSDDEQTLCRLAKRKRYDAPENGFDAAAMSLPSPTPSVHEISVDESTSGLLFPTAMHSTTTPAAKRKRSAVDIDDSNNSRLIRETVVNDSSPDLPLPAASHLPNRSSEKRKRSLSDSDDRPQKWPSNSQRVQHQTVSDPICFPTHLSTQLQMNLDDWLEEMLASNNPVNRDIPSPVTDESFDESSEFVVDYYNYDFSTFSDNATNISHSEPHSGTATLQCDVAIPHLQVPAVSDLWNDADASACNVDPEQINNVSSFSWEFDVPSVSPESESWQSVLLADMLSSRWTNDSLSIDSVLSQSTWAVADMSSNQSISPINISPNTSFSSAPLRLPVTEDAKSVKLQHYHKLLAEAQLLRAELSV